jgi:endoglucanase
MTKHILPVIFLLSVLLSFSCNRDEEETEIVFNSNPDTLVFPGSGGELTISINMNGNKWIASSNQSWCVLSVASSTVPYAQITVTADANPTGKERSAILTFIMDGTETMHVGVAQSEFYPDYSRWKSRDASGMTNNAVQLAKMMFAGWNLGNSLEVPGNETAWGNPLTTQEMINGVKASGINTVRIPCAWDSYIENAATCKISPSWLNRVKEVVDFCISQDMFVILNIHWDGGWLENNPTYKKQNEVLAKQTALWQQIAMKFRDYDEHLLFAGTNEVHTDATPVNENFVVQMSYNQAFVNAVRSTGGRNSYRNLVIQAYNTNIDYASTNLLMPADSVSGRLMAEVHYYNPWEFCGLEADATWGTVKNLWGSDYAQYGPVSSWGQEDYLRSQFGKMKTKFANKGIPVILGEFGVVRRSALAEPMLGYHLASRAYYLKYAAQYAKNNGMVPVVWDNGFTGNLGFGIFNRGTGSVFDQQALDEYIAGATAGVYPF